MEGKRDCCKTCKFWLDALCYLTPERPATKATHYCPFFMNRKPGESA